MPRYKYINNELVQYTAEEEALRDAEETAWTNNRLNEALNYFRIKRNALLAETDWMANSDITMSDDWKTYRQALRDLTNGLDTVEKVEAVEFPTKPSGE